MREKERERESERERERERERDREIYKRTNVTKHPRQLFARECVTQVGVHDEVQCFFFCKRKQTTFLNWFLNFLPVRQ